ncbi:MAG: hypothetical protein ACREL1_01835 [bacterium]
MFIGQFAVAFAGKKVAPKVSLGVLFLAAQFLDVLWPIFALLGIEHFRIVANITEVSPFDFYDFPLSHSLIMTLVWAVGFGLIYFIAKGNAKASGVLCALVLSHWFLDLVVHRKDLPVFLNGPYWGWGLWNSKIGTLLVEFGLLAIGAWIYKACTKPKDSVGDWLFYGLVFVLAAFYVVRLQMPTPSDTTMVAWSEIIVIWGFIAWGAWSDHFREAA